MMRGFFRMLIITFPACVCSTYTVMVDRDVQDTKYGLIPCMDTGASLRMSCTCIPGYSTVMSLPGCQYFCMSPWNVGCYHSLLESKQAYLVTENDAEKEFFVTRRIIPPLPYNIGISGILVWNLKRSSDIGVWHDVTKQASNIFTLKSEQGHTNDSLVISNVDIARWQGHVIKIVFAGALQEYTACLTIKVKGRITYPFDIDAFKSNLSGPSNATKQIPPPTTPTTTTMILFSTQSRGANSSVISTMLGKIGSKGKRVDIKVVMYIIAGSLTALLLLVLTIHYHGKHKNTQTENAEIGDSRVMENIYTEISPRPTTTNSRDHGYLNSRVANQTNSIYIQPVDRSCGQLGDPDRTDTEIYCEIPYVEIPYVEIPYVESAFYHNHKLTISAPPMLLENVSTASSRHRYANIDTLQAVDIAKRCDLVKDTLQAVDITKRCDSVKEKDKFNNVDCSDPLSVSSDSKHTFTTIDVNPPECLPEQTTSQANIYSEDVIYQEIQRVQ